MIPDDELVTVREVLALKAKGDDMTLREKTTLDGWYKELARASYVQKDGGTKRKLLTGEQMKLAQHLPCMIQLGFPRLDEVMGIFGLAMSDTFVSTYDDDSCGCGRLACDW